MVTVSKNFYIRRKKPILCFPQFHIGKRSAGWKPLMQASRYEEDTFRFETQRPVIESISDLENAVATDEWEIVDEYGMEYTIDEFKRYMLDDFPIEDGCRDSHVEVIKDCEVDNDGFEWTYNDFF